MSGNIKIVTDASFDADVLQSTKPVLVDFWAEWCGPCRAFLPTFQAASETYPDVVFAKLNIEENPQITAKYGIMSIPTLMLFMNGQIVTTKLGALNSSQLAAFIESNI